LLALNLALFDEVERMFSEAIAERTGTDAEVDLYPRLLSAATAAAMKTALKLWSTGKSSASQADLITEAFARMRAGLPEPDRSSNDPASPGTATSARSAFESAIDREDT
jgi:hypothetical protein